jgi:hypothetical protein
MELQLDKIWSSTKRTEQNKYSLHPKKSVVFAMNLDKHLSIFIAKRHSFWSRGSIYLGAEPGFWIRGLKETEAFQG